MLAAAAAGVTQLHQTSDAIPGNWIVQFDNLRGSHVKQLRAANALVHSAGLKASRHLGADGLVLIESAPNLKLADVRGSLSHVTGFKFVEPDYLITADALPNDAKFKYQWGLNNTGQTSG